MTTVRIKTLPHYNMKAWGLPAYGSKGAAGFDLRAAPDIRKNNLKVSNPDLLPVLYGDDKKKSKALLKGAYLTVAPNSDVIFGSGICVEVPVGFELQIRSRSGKGIQEGLVITHGVGTIDSDYRGEIMIAIRNISREERDIYYGERVAQAILAPVTRIEWDHVEELDNTQRGINGFGSTGR